MPSYGGILILYYRAAPEQAYLITLEIRLLADLGVGLFFGGNAFFDEATDSSPATVVAAHSLAALDDEEQRFVLIKAHEKTRDNWRQAHK